MEAATRFRTARRLGGSSLVALLLMTIAACGDDGGGSEDADERAADETSQRDDTTELPDADETEGSDAEGDDADTEAISFEEASAAYNTCLEDLGVDPSRIPPNLPADELAGYADEPPEVLMEMGLDQAVIEAHAECWPALEAAIDAGATPPEASDTTTTTVDQQLASQVHDAVTCLNERGWDFLEPGVEAGALEMAPRESGFNWDDPAFLDDQRECQQQAGMMP